MPSKPYTLDFQNDCYVREFHSLFEGTNIHFADQGLALDYKSYKSGNVLLVFDFSADLTDCDGYKLIFKGGLRLELKFAKPLDQLINVVVLAEWDSCLRINRERAISLDY